MTNESILDLICNFLTVLSKITISFFAFEFVYLMRKAGISSPISGNDSLVLHFTTLFFGVKNNNNVFLQVLAL
jgi:hypothetical protein